MGKVQKNILRDMHGKIYSAVGESEKALEDWISVLDNPGYGLPSYASGLYDKKINIVLMISLQPNHAGCDASRTS
jgi:hypothetical protein